MPIQDLLPTDKPVKASPNGLLRHVFGPSVPTKKDKRSAKTGDPIAVRGKDAVLIESKKQKRRKADGTEVDDEAVTYLTTINDHDGTGIYIPVTAWRSDLRDFLGGAP